MGSTDWESNTADTVTSEEEEGRERGRREGGGEKEGGEKEEGEKGREKEGKGEKKGRNGKFFTRAPNKPLHAFLHDLIPRTGATAWV